MTLGFLHTAVVHVDTFRTLTRDVDPNIEVVEIVDESLLQKARQRGLADRDVLEGITYRLHELVVADANVIVCTCSTIAGIAESIGESIGRTVLRIDRPMAERAVEIGGRIAVIAALASTLAPTRELIEQVAADSGSQVSLSEHLVEDAWQHFEAGDSDAYLAAIVKTLERIAGDADVIVLAQASMATAADLVDLPIEVLSSPKLAVAAGIAALNSASAAGS